MNRRVNPKHIDGGDLSALIDGPRNQEVTSYLVRHQPSCHSDIGEVLIRSADKCGEWFAFSPSFEQCAFVLLVTNRTVFALGMGQRSACYRLPGRLHTTALATGAVEVGEIGADWVRFELFRADRPNPDLAFWTLKAYTTARGHHG